MQTGGRKMRVTGGEGVNESRFRQEFSQLGLRWPIARGAGGTQQGRVHGYPEAGRLFRDPLGPASNSAAPRISALQRRHANPSNLLLAAAISISRACSVTRQQLEAGYFMVGLCDRGRLRTRRRERVRECE
eukprot:6203869-Pleurochrysis_carterae.AAC.2